MSRKPETTFIGSVHKHLPVELYHMKNNNAYTGGIPDVWYSGNKADLWVEYKFIEIPKRETTLIKPDFSTLQLEWLYNRKREGRNVAAIVGCKEGGVIIRTVNWGEPFVPSQFVKELMTRGELARWILLQTMR
jgi:hypothetical protein